MWNQIHYDQMILMFLNTKNSVKGCCANFGACLLTSCTCDLRHCFCLSFLIFLCPSCRLRGVDDALSVLQGGAEHWRENAGAHLQPGRQPEQRLLQLPALLAHLHLAAGAAWTPALLPHRGAAGAGAGEWGRAAGLHLLHGETCSNKSPQIG